MRKIGDALREKIRVLGKLVRNSFESIRDLLSREQALIVFIYVHFVLFEAEVFAVLSHLGSRDPSLCLRRLTAGVL